MRRTTSALLAVSVLSVLAGCGSQTPEGTLTKDQVSDEAKVEEVNRIKHQVFCPEIEAAEDEIMFGQGETSEEEVVATSFVLGEGKTTEWVDNSVWEVSDPKGELAELEDAIDACAKEYPEYIAPIDPVQGFPDGVGYTSRESGFLRRVFVPLESYVVVVGVYRSDSDEFTVKPEDLMKDAVAAAKKLDAKST